MLSRILVYRRLHSLLNEGLLTVLSIFWKEASSRKNDEDDVKDQAELNVIIQIRNIYIFPDILS